jgi:hypothetical protein
MRNRLTIEIERDNARNYLGFGLLLLLFVGLLYVHDAVTEQAPCTVTTRRNTSEGRTQQVDVQCGDGRTFTLTSSVAQWPRPCFWPGTMLEKRLGEPVYRVNGQLPFQTGMAVVGVLTLFGVVSIARGLLSGRRRRAP